jgi:hypothetical protein
LQQKELTRDDMPVSDPWLRPELALQTLPRRGRSESPPHRPLRIVQQKATGLAMTNGTVTKLVRTHGSRWGQVRSIAGAYSFFNDGSFARPEDFDLLAEGDLVTYLEEVDRVNGFRATQLVIIEALPAPEPAVADQLEPAT